jgi:hypothetical protein
MPSIGGREHGPLNTLFDIFKGYKIVSYNKVINDVDMPCWALQKRRYL